MAETAFLVKYRDEWIQGFERLPTVLRSTVTTDAMVNGRQAVFLIANSAREATTRGSNGLIPASADDLTQVTLTLTEAHDLSRKTGYNIFAGQADQRAVMQAQGRNVINRKIDDVIITELDTATVTFTGGVMSKGVASKARTLLGNAEVPIDDRLFFAVTPAQWAHLENDPSFASADYVEMKPLVNGMPNPQAPSITVRRWANFNWFTHTGLPGKGTSTAKCFAYHSSAIGYCYNNGDVQVAVGYDKEQDYSYARHTIYHGAKKLQTAGIIEVTVDDTGYSA